MPGLVVVEPLPLQEAQPSTFLNVHPDFLGAILDLLRRGPPRNPITDAIAPGAVELLLGAWLPGGKLPDKIALFLAHVGQSTRSFWYVASIVTN